METAQLQSDIPTQFKQAMFDAGIGSDEIPMADSQLHRFRVEGDKNGSKNGWYVLFGDNNPKGVFGSWKLGTNDIWSLKNFREYTPQEKAEWAKQQAEAKKERDKAQALTHKEARAEAERLWSKAKPEIGNHKYLRDKGIQAYNIRSDGFKLLIPLRDTKGVLHSLQTIDPTGRKLFLSGGAIKGNYFGIGKPKDTLVVVEGYSTGVSIHEATGYGIAVAFNAGNLLPVAKALREKFPDIEIIIAGDNDAWTEGNPGKRQATEATQAIKGKFVIPEFINTESKPTDFNDLARLEGLDLVKQQIEKAVRLKEPTNSNPLGCIVNLKCAGDVQPQPINWLWPNRIALGKLTLIAGDPGLGKSLLSIELAKHVTKGIRWPIDDTVCGVLLLSLSLRHLHVCV